MYGAIPANPQDVRAAPGHQDPDSEPNSPTRRVLAGTLPESGAGGVTPEQGSSPAPERGSDRAEAAELEAAGAECARLAQLHNAAERCKAGSYSDLLELIAPELPWFCLPGPGECSLVLDTETTGLPWWVGASDSAALIVQEGSPRTDAAALESCLVITRARGAPLPTTVGRLDTCCAPLTCS